MEYREQSHERTSTRKSLVLCFDGTGNKLTESQTGGDSNIIEIFSKLDRQDRNLQAYYQPGIGTYVQTKNFSHTGTFEKISSWYQKTKDSAIGTSFEHHVMGGYRFLMRFYKPGDAVYFFGFSRGAYTARFLAQMLDYVGLLTPGNEELQRFAWKTFAKWQSRSDATAEAREQKHKTYLYMKKFRETFSIPVTRIQFMGLFDVVNSVPKFEAAWMQRSKFPYTARSSAKIQRHAVSIDERRAKFRQDLISQKRPSAADREHHHHWPHLHHHHDSSKEERSNGTNGVNGQVNSQQGPRDETQDHLEAPRPPSRQASMTSLQSMTSQLVPAERAAFAGENGDQGKQDILEVWFSGCHADIGGGWPLDDGEEVSISRLPLIWMIREAQRAGLRFDQAELRKANLVPDDIVNDEPYHDAQESQARQSQLSIPRLEVDGHTMNMQESSARSPKFHTEFLKGATHGKSHDSLQFKQGTPAGTVAAYQMMEHIPFRRMDLQSDGSWKPVRWPLPMGETRDIPADALIHSSVLRRMEADSKYRPGNLIVGGGGRGIRHAPASVGMGKWKVVRGHGDPIDEIVTRATEAGNIAALEEK